MEMKWKLVFFDLLAEGGGAGKGTMFFKARKKD